MINRLKISLALFPLFAVVLIGAYVYSLWAGERRHSAEIPVEAASMMMRDLLAFHEKRGGFPEDLKELEGIVWDKNQNRNFSINYRAIGNRNYFYLYTRIDPHHFTLWSIPMGKFREESPTGFLSASTEGCRRWKGPALDADLVRKLDVNPSLGQLGVLGLTEQPGCDFTKSKKG
ncbi:MAG: hypothetical protein ABI999_12470 [Acidobacteriota bacterium]